MLGLVGGSRCLGTCPGRVDLVFGSFLLSPSLLPSHRGEQQPWLAHISTVMFCPTALIGTMQSEDHELNAISFL